MTAVSHCEEKVSADSRSRGLARVFFSSNHDTKAGQALDGLDIRRPSQPTVGTAMEMYQRAEQLKALRGRFDSLLHDSRTRKAIATDTVQIPATADREGYCGDNHLAYWLGGLADLRTIQRLAPSAKFKNVLDFGGATGRFARHIPLHFPSAKVTIADLNVNHVEWVGQNFGPSVRGVKVSPSPHLPIADSSVTLCVGFSVFTHIDAYETGWLSEIYRVLAKRAYAVLTIHNEHVWSNLPTWPWIFDVLNANPDFRDVYNPEEPMPSERLVYDYPSTSGHYNCNVFMTSDYIRRVWGRWFEVVAIVPRAHDNFQTAVVVRKVD